MWCRWVRIWSGRGGLRPSRRAAVECVFCMFFGRSDLRIGQSEAKVDAESDFEVRFPAGPPNPVQKRKKHTKVAKKCVRRKKVSWVQMKVHRKICSKPEGFVLTL